MTPSNSNAVDGDARESGGTDRRTVLESIPAALLGAGAVGLTGTAAAQRGGTAGGSVDVHVIEELGTRPVASNAVDTLRLDPESGPPMTLVGLQVEADPVVPATAGSHTVEVALDAGDEPMPLIEGTASHDQPLRFHGLAWREADRGTTPVDETATLLTVRGAPVSDDTGLVVSYRNETNARQTQTRTARLLGARPRN
jgi:hypothetical protein